MRSTPNLPPNPKPPASAGTSASQTFPRVHGGAVGAIRYLLVLAVVWVAALGPHEPFWAYLLVIAVMAWALGRAPAVAARKAAEAALMEQRAELSDFLENATEGMHAVDPDGIIVWVNRFELDMLGYTAEEYVGQPIARFHVDPNVVGEIFARLGAAGVVVNLEAELRCKDGSIRHVLISSSMRMREGRALHTRCFTRDITERRAAAEALRSSEGSWNAVLESSVDPIVVLDARGDIVEFSPAAEQLFVIPRSEAAGRPLVDIATLPEQRALHQLALAGCLAGGAPVNRLEVRAQRSDRRPLALELTIRRMFEHGPPRFIVYIRDLTERRDAEAVIREQGALLEATLDVLVDPVVYLDRSGLVRIANSASVRLLGDPLIGVTPDAWAAQLPVDFLGGPGTVDSLRDALASGRTVRSRRMEFVDVVGAPRVALASIVPVIHAGAIQGAVVYMHDVTQESTLAAELENANNELMTRFEELLAQQEVLAAQSEEVAKQRAQLADRNADLASASRLKSEVLATMSHELRTPLNAVIGFAEVLLVDSVSPLGEGHRAYVQDIRKAGEQLLLLINDVLDLTRIEAGRLQIDTERMDLAHPVLQARELTSVFAKERRVTVVDAIAPGHRFVVADPDRVRQVVLNLLSNALKFTPSGGSVTLRAVEIPGGFARVSVTDTGIGIDSNDVHKLFQPFTQLDTGLARRRGGTGLGLAISRQLVEAMKGTIGCESVLGRGSTFFFTLPLADPAGLGLGGVSDTDVGPIAAGERAADQPFGSGWGAERAMASAPGSEKPPSVATAGQGSGEPPLASTTDGGQRLHVLIVDDNVVNRRVLRSMLASTRCDLTEAQDGSTAIQLVRDLRPGVILMDLQMPEMDGLTATRILRADPATAMIPVIAITAHAMVGDPERAAAAGCVGYLAKPVGRENLMKAIERAIGSSAWRD
ncbi:MAG: PAS domain S-box protein [Pseudomonadota bacterium]|nr:PAS domain S-box protein [Pseudomonadota bacterium]